LLIASFSLLATQCNLFDRELGDATLGTTSDTDVPLDSLAGGWNQPAASTYFEVFSTPQSILAGRKDHAIITAKVFDRNHNPLAGQVVRFASEVGSIQVRDTTDENGVATAKFSPIPANQDVPILVGAYIDDKWRFAGTTVNLKGVTIQIVASSLDTLIGKTIPLTVRLRDGNGEPVPTATIRLEGAAAAQGLSDGAGEFKTSVSLATPGTVRIKASALGAADSIAVGFFAGTEGSRSSNLNLYADPGRVAAAEGATSTITAILYDDRHNPVAGKTISFAATEGRISASSTTNDKGVATATFFSTPKNVEAEITATASLNDALKSATASLSLVGIDVNVQASKQDALLNDSVAIAIRVKDGLGKPLGDIPVTVSGANVSNGKTNGSGLLTVKVSSDKAQTTTITASALGASDTARVLFWKEIPKATDDLRTAIGNLRIFVTPSHLKASNTDQAQVRVVAFDNLNNPLSGREVRFTTQAGIISGLDSTDEAGVATATLRAVPFNTDTRVTATMSVEDSTLTVATKVTFEGLRIEILPAKANALLNEQVPVSLRVIDGSGSPVPDVTIQFSGNPGIGTTDGTGTLLTSLTSGTQKRVVLTADALGAADSGFVDFWNVLPGKEQPVDSIRNLRIFSSRTQLRADNSDMATITVILTKEGNNPATGDVIRFSSNLGIIGEKAIVDANGRATVTLHSVPVNGTCRVTALAEGRNLTASTELLFSGLELQLIPEKIDHRIGEDAIINAVLKDGSGNPIGGDKVDFILAGLSGATFNNGEPAYSVVLNPAGTVQIRVRSTSAGSVQIKGKSLNTADSVSLNFSNNTLSVTTDKSAIGINSGDSIRVTATYVNGSNQPVTNALIRFAASAGTLTGATATTDGAGKASVFIKSASFAGSATVQASAAAGTAQTQVQFLAAIAAKIVLQATPDNIVINGGSSTLRAEITDNKGNRVDGQEVTFRILTGPGGGETLPKPVALAQNGIALSQIFSGSVPSAYRGVTVEAKAGAVADTTKITFSGPARTITISRPEDDSVTVPEGGDLNATTFSFNVGAVVQDINGNPVADGTEVHFGAVVTGMAVVRRLNDGWTGLGTSGAGSVERKPRYKNFYQDIPFEDINNNKAWDPGIDLNLDGNPSVAVRGEDINGDGAFDWNANQHTYWYDFNNNGICDSGVPEEPNPFLVPLDSVYIFHDLNNDGVMNGSEVLNGGSCNDQPASRDFPFHFWETRRFLDDLPFTENDFAVVIPASAVTKGGIADVQISYPRQLAQRLFVTVNAEVNGIRDKDGERFVLPKVVGK
jgi:adhesin/invasin